MKFLNHTRSWTWHVWNIDDVDEEIHTELVLHCSDVCVKSPLFI